MQTTTVEMIAELRARPAHAEDVAALLTEFAEQVRKRPGCERVEVYRQLEAPETFVGIYSFADEQALAEHLDDSWRQQVVQRAARWLAERPRRFTMQRWA